MQGLVCIPAREAGGNEKKSIPARTAGRNEETGHAASLCPAP